MAVMVSTAGMPHPKTCVRVDRVCSVTVVTCDARDADAMIQVIIMAVNQFDSDPLKKLSSKKVTVQARLRWPSYRVGFKVSLVGKEKQSCRGAGVQWIELSLRSLKRIYFSRISILSISQR